MRFSDLKKHSGLIGTITGIIGLVFSGVGVYRNIDYRLDEMSKSIASVSAQQNKNDSKNRLHFIDIQVLIVEAELRVLDRITKLSENEKRQKRILEQQLIILNSERTRILGAP